MRTKSAPAPFRDRNVQIRRVAGRSYALRPVHARDDFRFRVFFVFRFLFLFRARRRVHALTRVVYAHAHEHRYIEIIILRCTYERIPRTNRCNYHPAVRNMITAGWRAGARKRRRPRRTDDRRGHRTTWTVTTTDAHW